MIIQLQASIIKLRNKHIIIEANQTCLIREFNYFIENNANIEIKEISESKIDNNYKIEIIYETFSNI